MEKSAAAAAAMEVTGKPSALASPPPPPSSAMAAAPSSASSTAPAPPTSPSSAALVFTGTSEDDVALAKSFWNSVTLQPPLESRLNSRRDSLNSGGGGASSRRGSQSGGLPVDGPGLSRERGGSLCLRSLEDNIREGSILEIIEAEKNNLKEQYLQKAKKREEIIALLKKQREERIVKESISQLHKPQNKTQESAKQIPGSDMEDKDSVRALI